MRSFSWFFITISMSLYALMLSFSSIVNTSYSISSLPIHTYFPHNRIESFSPLINFHLKKLLISQKRSWITHWIELLMLSSRKICLMKFFMLLRNGLFLSFKIHCLCGIWLKFVSFCFDCCINWHSLMLYFLVILNMFVSMAGYF